MRELRAAAAAVVVLTLVLGVAYPLAMTGVSGAVFGGRAAGSLVEQHGRTVASRLIGQDFSKDPRLFAGRPSATGYDAAATAFDDQGPNQRALTDQMKAYVKDYLAREGRYTPGLRAAAIPVDAVTTSASGIDPQISWANARIQANRVARRGGLPLARVLALAEQDSSRPLFGLAGERSANVVELNLAIQRLEATR